MVGFEEGETQRHHVEMAKDLVGPDKRLQMKSVVVTSPDSLVNIPPSKVRLTHTLSDQWSPNVKSEISRELLKNVIHSKIRNTTRVLNQRVNACFLDWFRIYM